MLTAEPACRVTPTAGVIVGALFGALTVKLNVLVLVEPQLSVAVTVTTYGVPEAGPALLMVITPVAAFPLNVPLKPGAAAETVATLPLSVGAALGVTVVPFPAIKVVAP